MGLYVVTIPCYCRLGFVHPDSHASFQPDETSRRERGRKVSVLRLKLTSFYLFSFSGVSCTAACSRAALEKKKRTSARLCALGSTPSARRHWNRFSMASPRSRRKSWDMPPAPCRTTSARSDNTRFVIGRGRQNLCVRCWSGIAFFASGRSSACERRGDVVKSAWVCSRYMKYRKPPLRWRRCRHERPTSPHRT